MAAYESFGKYFIGFIPNLLSYVFVYDQWADTAKNYKAENDTIGLTYLYCHISKLVFFYNNEHDELVDPILLASSRSSQRINFFEGVEFYLLVIEAATNDLLEYWTQPL
jgi:hypothetical protein